jgi:hypothetical protein
LAASQKTPQITQFGQNGCDRDGADAFDGSEMFGLGTPDLVPVDHDLDFRIQDLDLHTQGNEDLFQSRRGCFRTPLMIFQSQFHGGLGIDQFRSRSHEIPELDHLLGGWFPGHRATVTSVESQSLGVQEIRFVPKPQGTHEGAGLGWIHNGNEQTDEANPEPPVFHQLSA